MELRTASRSDLAAIKSVAAASLDASYDDVFDEDLRQHAVETWYGAEDDPVGDRTDERDAGGLAGNIEDEDSYVVLAEKDGEVVGFAQAFLVEGAEAVGRIEWIHVHPDHRGSGIGGSLLDRAEEELVDAAASRVEGRVLEANQEGKEFYKRRGYDEAHERRLTLGDEWVAERTLVREFEESAGHGTDQRRVTDGEEVIVAFDDSARGSEGPFYGAYLDEEREQRYGWYCGVCDSLDVNMDAMGQLECGECGNRRKATRWDATYGG
jgi:ribosomal protein S18 acetylase RimI-like enzyme